MDTGANFIIDYSLLSQACVRSWTCISVSLLANLDSSPCSPLKILSLLSSPSLPFSLLLSFLFSFFLSPHIFSPLFLSPSLLPSQNFLKYNFIKASWLTMFLTVGFQIHYVQHQSHHQYLLYSYHLSLSPVLFYFWKRGTTGARS